MTFDQLPVPAYYLIALACGASMCFRGPDTISKMLTTVGYLVGAVSLGMAASNQSENWRAIMFVALFGGVLIASIFYYFSLLAQLAIGGILGASIAFAIGKTMGLTMANYAVALSTTLGIGLAIFLILKASKISSAEIPSDAT